MTRDQTPTPQGRFITFEGGEGSGKSTQVARLKTVVEAAGYGVVCTREPGGSPGGEQIRDLLVNGDTGRWEPLSEALLNYAARHEHLQKLILPSLALGKWVISDRFSDSTLAYQGYGHVMDREIIRRLHRLVVGDFTPDLTLILDVPVEVGLQRALTRNRGEDRYERIGAYFHDRLRNGFLDIARKNPARCQVIDATLDMDTVAGAVRDALIAKFGAKFGGQV